MLEFKYDVAFSFVKDDEALATQLNELLAPRIRTFLYSRRQEVVGGTDGELTFNRVFSEESRVVVVLYRATWGSTPWTRIEETAIRNRAYNEGYDFVLFIPLDKPGTVPPWLPKTRIWIGLDRWGAQGAASVIEARVQESGGDPREETAVDRAVAIDRARVLKTAREEFNYSQDAVNAARGAVTALFKQLGLICEQVSRTSESFKLQLIPNASGTALEVRAARRKLLVSWVQQFANVLEHSELYVGIQRFDTPYQAADVRERRFYFALEAAGRTAWADSSKNKFFSTEQLADEILDLLLHELKNEHVK